MDNIQEPVSEPEIVTESAVEAPEPESKSQSYWQRFKRFIGECKRVMKVIQRPSREEFYATAKVSALGIGILGLLGFLLSMIQQLVI